MEFPPDPLQKSIIVPFMSNFQIIYLQSFSGQTEYQDSESNLIPLSNNENRKNLLT